MPTPDTSGENRAELIRRSNWRERLIPNGEQPGPVVKTGFGTLLARRGHFDRDTRIVRWLKDVARFPPPTDIPAANLVFNPLSHPRQAQLDPNLDAITRRLFPMCDEGSIPRQSGTLSAGSDAHTIPVGGTARGSRSGGGGQPNGIDNQSALYYWLHIAPTKPEAQLLAAHLGLNFPDPADTMYRVTLGLKYPVFRLIAMGEDTPELLATLLGPNWEAAISWDHITWRLEALAKPAPEPIDPDFTERTWLNKCLPYWTPRVANRAEKNWIRNHQIVAPVRWRERAAAGITPEELAWWKESIITAPVIGMATPGAAGAWLYSFRY